MHPFTWDYDRVLVYLPFIDFPIYWYGFLFATGVFFGQLILKKNLLSSQLENEKSFQNLLLNLVLSIALGARLFDVIFYQDVAYFLKHPIEILNFRAGGLASHGGFLGFLIALFIHAHKKKVSILSYLSPMIAPACLLAFFIRLGNLFNQEILGKAYSGLGSIIFTNPLDGSSAEPRHPVVIYEALSYLIIGFLVQRLKIDAKQKVGIALTTIFGVRMLLELMKEEQSIHLLPYGITMGMILSMPIVVTGFLLIFNSQGKQYKKSRLKHQGEV